MIGNFMTKYIYQKIKYVSLIITNENNDLFVSQRSNNSKPMNGYFQPIGGKIEDNETIIEAVKREADEEAGIEVNGLKPQPQFIFHYTVKGFNYFPKRPFKLVKRTVYVYELKSSTQKIIENGITQNMEPENFTEWTWKPINELQQLQCITTLEKYIEQKNGSLNKNL